MDLSSLKAFVSIVQTGSFTGAAKALKSHKAGLSRTIAHLEKGLGVRLLERTTRRVRLTAIGQAIYDRAVAVLAAIDDIEATAASQHGEPRGVLRVMVDPELGSAGVGRWLNEYAEKYPEVRIEADLSGRNVDLLHEAFDLAVRLGPPLDPDPESNPNATAATHKLGELSYGLYASPAYLDRQGTPKDGDDLRQHPLLMSSGAAQRGWRLITLSREMRIDGPARLRANNSLLMRDAAVSGLGIALLPNAIGKEEVTRGTLRRVLSAWAAPKIPVHAVLPGVGLPTSKVRAFVELASASLLT
jgi:DNA-binding transcriptional LysR family regulator